MYCVKNTDNSLKVHAENIEGLISVGFNVNEIEETDKQCIMGNDGKLYLEGDEPDTPIEDLFWQERNAVDLKYTSATGILTKLQTTILSLVCSDPNSDKLPVLRQMYLDESTNMANENAAIDIKYGV